MDNMKSKQEESKRDARHKFNVVQQFAYVHRSEYVYIQLINQFGLQYNIFIAKPYHPQNTQANLAVNRVSPNAHSNSGIRTSPFAATAFASWHLCEQVLSVGRVRWVVRTAVQTPSPCGLRLLNCSDIGERSDGRLLAALLVLLNFSLCPIEYEPFVPTII